MTNAERVLLLKRARLEIQRVRDELDCASATCPKCRSVFRLDESARQLEDDLEVVDGKLLYWSEAVGARRPTSERVSSET